MSRFSHRSARIHARVVASSPAVAGFRPTSAALAIAAAFSLPLMAQAQTGAQVVHGQASFVRNGSNLVVTTVNGVGTSHSAINWQSFSVPAGSITQFNQPSANSTSINRVVTNTPSAIFGTLSSNGKLVLVNQSGITVGKGAVVDTAGFTASTLGMNDADAIAGRLLFTGNSGGVLQVDGRIVARSGDIVLIAPTVQTGVDAVVQSHGATVLAAGQKVEITGRGLEGIRMEVQAPGNEARNLGKLQGDAVGVFAGTLKHSGLVQAQAVTAEGGKVVLRSGGEALVSGTVTAAAGDKGGQVDVLGQRVGLLAGAAIDASGAQGGGQVRIGGDFQGRNADVPNAQRTTVDAGATIKADATVRGDGGRVIVWADESTNMAGRISARGGAEGGDGGFAEVSGKRFLEFSGRVNLAAPQGRTGNLLLDPEDLTIVSGTAAGPNQISATTVSQQLDDGSGGGANVQLTTSFSVSGGPGNGGMITLANDATVSWGNTNTLSMLADKGIAIDGTVNAPAGALQLQALDGNIVGTGSIRVSSLHAAASQQSSLSGTGGMIRLNGANNLVGTIAGVAQGDLAEFTFVNQGNLVIGTASNAYSSETGIRAESFEGVLRGNVSVTAATGSLAVDAGASVRGGSIALEATAGDIDIGTVVGTVTTTSMIEAGTGAVRINAGGALRVSKVSPPAPSASPVSSGVHIVGEGAVTIDATGDIDFDGYTTLQSRTASVGVTSTSGNIQGLVDVYTGGGLAGTVTLTANSGGIQAGSISTNGTLGSGHGGAVTITARDDIGVQNAIYTQAYSGGRTEGAGDGGAVSVTSTAGSIDLGSIDTSGGYGDDTSAGGDGGTVTLTAKNTAEGKGLVTVRGQITTQGGSTYFGDGGAAGNVTVEAGGNVELGDIGMAGGNRYNSIGVGSGGAGGQLSVTTAGSARVGSAYLEGGMSAGAQGGYGGTVTIRAAQDVVLANVSLGGGGSNTVGTDFGAGGAGGTLDVKSTVGSVTVSDVTMVGGYSNQGAGGQGGTILIDADKNVQLRNVSASGGYAGGSALGGKGGTLDVLSRNGSISIASEDYSYDPVTETYVYGPYPAQLRFNGGNSDSGTAGQGGTVLLRAAPGAAATVPADVGKVDILGQIDAYGGDSYAGTGGGGGSITILAHTDIKAGGLRARGGNASFGPGAGGLGGSVVLSAATGNVEATNVITAAGGYGFTSGDGGTVDVAAARNVTLTQVLANGGSAAQDSYSVQVGAPGGHGGSITLTAGESVAASLLDAQGGRGERGGPGVPAEPPIAGGAGGNGGSVTVSAGATDTNVSNLIIQAQGGDGGEGYFDGTVYVGSGGMGGNAGTLSLTAGGSLNVSSSAVLFGRGAGGLGGDGVTQSYAADGAVGPTLFFKAGEDLTLSDVDFGPSVAGLTGEAGRDLRLASDVYSEGGDITLRAGLNGAGILAIAANINTTGTRPPAPPPAGFAAFAAVAAAPTGAVTLSGPVVEIQSGQTVTSAGELQVIADAVTLDGSTDSGANRTVFRTLSTGRAIVLGDTIVTPPNPTPSPRAAQSADDDLVGGLNLTSDELSRVLTTNTIVVGDGSAAGGLQVAANVNVTTPALSLINAGAITQVAGTSLVASRLNVDGGSVALTDAVVDTLSGRGQSGTFTVNNTGSGTLTVGTVDGISGIASAGAVLLTTPGTLHLDQTVSSNATGTAVTVSADKLEVDVSNAVFSNTGRWLVYLSSPDGNVFGTGSASTLASGNQAIWNRTLGTDPVIAEAGNRYVFANQPAVTVTADPVTKVYDGSAAFALTFTHTGLVDASAYGGAFLQDTFSGALAVPTATKNVGSYAITQGDLGVAGYAITYVGDNATITPRALNVTATANNKVYDATTGATLAGFGDDRIAGDNLAFTASASFADKNVGTGKTVTVSGIAVTGTDAGNYTANTGTFTSANITPRALAVTASAGNKVYDGTTSAGITSFTDNRVAGDDLGFSASASFADKNAGTGKTVTVSGITLSGTDAGNYVANSSTATTADIARRALAVTATADNKVYDGTTAATLSGFGDDRVAGDSLGFAGTAAFSDKNAGTAKTVTVSGITLSGADAGNYIANGNTSTTADIARRALNVTATANDKVYDSTTAATVAGFGDDRVAGDVLGFSGSASFADKNAGVGKAVTVSAIAVTGTDAGNYVANTSALTSATITPRALAVGATGVDRVYNGSTVAQVGFVDNRIAGDSIGVSGSANFADKHVGTGKAVTVSGITLSGTDAGNYAPNTSTATTASISPKSITVQAAADTKVYDGTVASVGAPSVTSGEIFAGDTNAFSQKFDNRNAGTGKTLLVSGKVEDGNGGNNYLVTAVNSTSGVITPRQLTVTASADTKVYDGTTASAANPGVTGGLVSGDTITLDQVFANKNVGTGKVIVPTAAIADGNGGSNYQVALVNSSAGVITPKMLITSGGEGVDRTYDATRNATLTGTMTLTGTVAGDSVSVSGHTAKFADKNVGTAKPITVDVTLGGADAGNYTVQAPSGINADITQATAVVSGLSAQGKVYDGTTVATLTGTPTVSGVFAGDSVTVGGATGSFNDKNAGTGKAVQVAGLAVSGADAGNYLYVKPTQLTADITPAPLTIQANNQSKLEGATRTFNGSEFSAAGLVAGEQVASVTLTSAGAAASAPSGSYAITPSNAVGGAGFVASNYNVTYLNGALAVFTQDTLPAIVEVNNQVVTFATLFVQMAREQRPNGEPDIVLNDASCIPR